MNNSSANRAALYCRLSKEDIDKIDKGDDSASIINQRMLLEDYAVNNGFVVFKVYQDDYVIIGISLKKPIKPMFFQQSKSSKFSHRVEFYV